MATAMDVAAYFLAVIGNDEESDLTPMKLQKLCAYAQGLSLALLNRPLFEEEVQAWKHGPVIPVIYEKYKICGKRPIPSEEFTEHYARLPFDDESKFIIELTGHYYGSRTAADLRNMSHADFPGIFGSKKVISHEDIRSSFLKLPVVDKLLRYKLPPEDAVILSEKEFWDAVEN